MLLHQTLDLEKRREQVPLVFGSVDRVGKRLVVVERFQKRIEGVSVLVLGKVVVILRTVGFVRSVRFLGDRTALSLVCFRRSLDRSLYKKKALARAPSNHQLTAWQKKFCYLRRASALARRSGLRLSARRHDQNTGIDRNAAPAISGHSAVWVRNELGLHCRISHGGEVRENLETLI